MKGAVILEDTVFNLIATLKHEMNEPCSFWSSEGRKNKADVAWQELGLTPQLFNV